MNESGAHSSLYRAVWRWHFYAGLIVMPFLILLAVTGSLYLFKPEIERLVYGDMIEVAERGERASLAAVKATFEMALNGDVLQMRLPERSDRSIQALVRTPSGIVRTAYADPYDARFLGSTEYGGIMRTIAKVHSLQLFGFWASSLIEIAAGWAIIMVISGVFLLWPRRAGGGVVSVRGAPRQRVFWRDTHAIIGAFAGAFILFLAVTGMPWSMFWGANVQQWAAVQGLGRPAAPASVTPSFLLGVSQDQSSRHTHGQVVTTEQLPWALQQSDRPHSAHAPHDAARLSIDDAAAHFEALGVPRPFAVQFPEGALGAWAATYAPDQVEKVRLVYLDQHTGDVIGDVGYAEFGAAAKAIEWGIAVHEGRQYGAINRYLMLLACMAIVGLAITGLAMWWKRRPKGRLAAPPAPEQKAAGIMVLVVIGAIYPLTGLSIMVALCVDNVARRVAARMAR